MSDGCIVLRSISQEALPREVLPYCIELVQCGSGDYQQFDSAHAHELAANAAS